jgi:hypothetical protein
LDEMAEEPEGRCRRSPSTGCCSARRAQRGQLRQNLGAVGWSLTPEQTRKLDEASAVTAPCPYFPYRRQGGLARLNPPAV